MQSIRPIPVRSPRAEIAIPDSELRALRPESPVPPQQMSVQGPEVNRPGIQIEKAVESFVQSIDEKSKVAGRNVAALMAGEDMSLGETMISLQESQLSFQLMVEVRNKLLDGYQELMRMQV
jgi:flagellar hook-basal body complex protein FliE